MTAIIIASLLVCALLGAILLINIRQTSAMRLRIAQLQTEKEQVTAARILAESRLREAAARHTAEIASVRREVELQQQLTRQLSEQAQSNFRIMANDIMKQSTESLRTENSRRLSELIDPLRQQIDSFRRQVADTYSSEARERFSLQERIRELIEVNNTIGREARELSSALRGNTRTQGEWGEMVLETILERSGLRKGEEFSIQPTEDGHGRSLRDESGRGLRPDVVINYPGGRAMVIDSKVSLTAFVDYINTDSEIERKAFARAHLDSVNKHIAELANKNYHDYVGTERLDFTVMFIPNESAYAAAMTLDPGLWQKAYDKRVIIVSPTQLVGLLRLVAQVWNQDRQTRNALDIAEKAGAMYDKFVGLTDDLDRIASTLANSQKACEAALTKLSRGRGNLISRAEELRQLGARTKKQMRSSLSTPHDTDGRINDESQCHQSSPAVESDRIPDE